MESGVDFLKSQIDNAVVLHDAFLRAVVDHESQAQDQRFRDLCAHHIPRMQEHQRMLEGLQRIIADKVSHGNESAFETVRGTLKRAAGTAIGMARELADLPSQSDYLRLVGDIVMARQAEDMFKTFREGGRQLGIQQLADIGDIGERHHDDYVKEANRLVQQMFVEHARGSEYAFSSASTQPHQPGSP
jgi:hypothetical protein